MVKLKSFLLLFLVFSSLVRGEEKGVKESGINSLFKEIGFSPLCVSQTLALCEKSAEDSLLLGIQRQMESLQNFILKPTERQHRPHNCQDLFSFGDKNSGIRTVYPSTCYKIRPVSVHCDQTTDGGGWTVIQHREPLPQREDFFRKWVEYQRGFGNLTGEFWLGLNNIHALISDIQMELRVDLEDFEGEKRWAKYDDFFVADADGKYELHLGRYSGDAGDSFGYHSGHKFSTKDEDNDTNEGGSCSEAYRGGWWYGKCHGSNLNGFQHDGNHTSYADGINWSQFRGYHHSLKRTSMSIRPKYGQ